MEKHLGEKTRSHTISASILASITADGVFRSIAIH